MDNRSVYLKSRFSSSEMDRGTFSTCLSSNIPIHFSSRFYDYITEKHNTEIVHFPLFVECIHIITHYEDRHMAKILGYVIIFSNTNL